MKERVISVGILVFALTYFAGSMALKSGTLAQPGPGKFPVAIALCLLVAAAWNVWRRFQERGIGDERRRWAHIKPTGIAVILILYPVLLNTCSFLISFFIVLFALFRLLHFKTMWVSLMTALFTTIIAFVVCSGFLGVVVPGGAMEDFILRIIERGIMERG